MTADSSKRYPFWQAPFQAFWNKDFYRDVAYNWKGFGILYLMIVCLIAQGISLIPMAVTCIGISNNQELAEFVKQVPMVTLQDGKLSIDKPTPFAIKDLKSGSIIAEFRTDQAGTPQFGENDPPILVTRDAFAIQDPGKDSSNAKVFEFASMTGTGTKLSFDGSNINHAIKNFCLALPFLLFIAGTPLIWIGHLFQAAIYGGIAMLICNNMETPITFETGMRMAAIAITPNVVLSVLILLAAQVVSGMGVLSFIMMFASVGIAIAYIVVAAVAIKQPASPQVGELPAAR